MFNSNIKILRRLSEKSRKGFTLTELAVVLGVVGVIIGAIWAAGSHVQQSNNANQGIEELQTTAQNVLALMQGRTFAAAGDVTTNMITANVIPSWALISATQVSTPWGFNVTGGNNIQLKVFAEIPGGGKTASHVRISFYGVPNDGCIALISQATSCQVNERWAAFSASSLSASVSRAAAIRRRRLTTEPVPAGIRRPTMTFSLRPSSVSTLPDTAASVSTRVVSWNDAAEMKERVCSEALVMPCSTALPCAGRRFSSSAAFSLTSRNSVRSISSPARRSYRRHR
jgi:prepilin-type N-terminal cleavage/methylation domain-containing protein